MASTGAGATAGNQRFAESETSPLVRPPEPQAGSGFLRSKLQASDWMDRAMMSPAASNVDRVLEGLQEKGAIYTLKQQMFRQIYDTMGDEFMPDDMVRALAVKSERYHPWLATFLCVVTFGIFECFRPRDDEAVAVLTKNERVTMCKVERAGVFQNFVIVFKATFYVTLAFVVLNTIPLTGLLLTDAGSVTQEVSFVDSLQEGYRKHVVERIQRNLWLQAVAWGLFLVFFSFWFWTKLPHDYGMRYRQSHAASKVCCGQFSLAGGNWFRQCKWRLFFGRFPEQGALDHANSFSLGGGCVQVADKRELVLTKTANPFAPGSRKSLVIFIIVVLNLFTLVDAMLTYGYTPWTWLEEGKQRAVYCTQVALNSTMCDRKKCMVWGIEKWSQQQMDDPSFLKFCEGLHWIDETNETFSPGSFDCVPGAPPPCCSGCVSGSLDALQSKGVELFGLAVSFVCDFGTLAVAFAAAAAALSYVEEKDHVDIVFKKRMNFYTTELSNFNLTQHLANDFVNAVFDCGFRALSSSGEVVQGRQEQRVAPRRDYGDSALTGPQQDEDNADGANFQDVTCFDIDTESTRWEDFWERGNSLVQREDSSDSRRAWVLRVLIPVRCLGIADDEQVLAAWVEAPMLTIVMVLPLVITTAIFWLCIMCVPDAALRDLLSADDDSALIETHHNKALIATLSALMLFCVMFVSLFCWLFAATKHVCILTDVRLIYVRYTVKARLLLMFAPQVRVDCFRHDHQVTYGSMTTVRPTLYQRATRAPWTPGQLYMQPGFYGLLKIHRQQGNVLNVYQILSQLTKPDERPLVDMRTIEDAGVDPKYCESTVRDSMEPASPDVWRITHRQPDDALEMMPNLFLASKEEQPLFYWSFKQWGWIDQPHNTNTDVIVTTNRLYLFSRDLWKPFDAKYSLQYSTCWCVWLWKLVWGRRGLERKSSFLDNRMLLSFCTEVEIMPPVWYDPVRWPCRCPAVDTLCHWCTLCMTCADRRSVFCNSSSCSCIPRRARARASLQMMWRHRFNTFQRDLSCSIMPYALRDPTLVADVLERCGCGSAVVEPDALDQTAEHEKIDVLRKLMALVQDAANLKEKHAELLG